MIIIDGKSVSKKIREQISADIAEKVERYGRKPGLAVILVGENPASQVYVRNKIKACEEVGIESYSQLLSVDTTEDVLLNIIDALNNNSSVDGILVQLPLPKHINEARILERISVSKDVDGFCAVQMGNLVLGKKCLPACTANGVMELLKAYDIPVEGKNAVVVGRSNIVGKPVAMLLMHKNATVTICHSRTQNLPEITKKADILVVAIGKANYITENMVKEGAVVIDVGMNRVDGRLCGDVEFEGVSKKASFITPVPGGVGPMTIAMLMKNTLQAYCNTME